MIKYFFGAFLLVLASADNPKMSGSLADLIRETFTPPADLSKGNDNNGQPGDAGHGPPPVQVKPCGEGECVPFYQCSNGQVITEGYGLLDIRFGEEDNVNKEANTCKGYLEICCTLKAETPTIPEVPYK